MRNFRIAVLDLNGDVMEEELVEALGMSQALSKVQFGRGPESRIQKLIKTGAFEVSIMRDDTFEEAMREAEPALSRVAA